MKKIELEKLSKEELEKLRKELGIRLSTIDNILDRQAYGKQDEDEIAELEEEYDEIEKMLEKIRGLLNNKIR